jgi:flagellin
MAMTSQVIFNEDGSSALDIEGVELQMPLAWACRSVAGDRPVRHQHQSTPWARWILRSSTLRSQASEFGSNLSIVETREDFTKSMINTLETGAANLTLADTNEEGANLLALQTRQQLSTTSLSLATQADQNVLRLF